MINCYLRILIVFMVLGITMPLNSYAYDFSQVKGTDTIKAQSKSSTKITDTRLNKPSDPKTSIQLNFIPFKPSREKLFGTNTIMAEPRSSLANEKILTNVRVYPNPISDVLNMSFSLNKDANVTIKIMDVLGNEKLTLFSKGFSKGDHDEPVSISSRITSGFYFLRVSAGSEIITKRISVL